MIHGRLINVSLFIIRSWGLFGLGTVGLGDWGGCLAYLIDSSGLDNEISGMIGAVGGEKLL